MSDLQTSDFRIIIVGASTRAAAFSAIRAGYAPICLDRYGDADLRYRATVETFPETADELRELLRKWPGVPVIYTGGLENRPDLLDAIAETHPLWGNTSEAVSLARDNQLLQEVARLARVGFPEWKTADQAPPPDGTWLLRPQFGCGGRGISVWTPEQSQSEILQESHFFQRKIEGDAYSALFIATAEAGDVRFIGLTKQLIGLEECNSSGFQWCGNIAPMAFPVPTELSIRRFGNVLKWKMKVVGLFGIDFILDADGFPWVTEVNPRYPASLELLEHITGIPFLREHCRCFSPELLPETDWNLAHPGEFVGKAVFYSGSDLTLSTSLIDPASVPVETIPSVTDLPEAGKLIEKGAPVCTLFAESTSSEETEQQLLQQLRALGSQFGGAI